MSIHGFWKLLEKILYGISFLTASLCCMQYVASALKIYFGCWGQVRQQEIDTTALLPILCSFLNWPVKRWPWIRLAHKDVGFPDWTPVSWVQSQYSFNGNPNYSNNWRRAEALAGNNILQPLGPQTDPVPSTGPLQKFQEVVQYSEAASLTDNICSANSFQRHLDEIDGKRSALFAADILCSFCKIIC